MSAPAESNMRLPELRELIRRARSYVAGEIHFSYVCCAASDFREAAKFYTANSVIQRMAEEWATMATRVWPEWAQIDDPISEAQFKSWIEEQLSVFEPA